MPSAYLSIRRLVDICSDALIYFTYTISVPNPKTECWCRQTTPKARGQDGRQSREPQQGEKIQAWTCTVRCERESYLSWIIGCLPSRQCPTVSPRSGSPDHSLPAGGSDGSDWTPTRGRNVQASRTAGRDREPWRRGWHDRYQGRDASPAGRLHPGIGYCGQCLCRSGTGKTSL